MNGNFDFLEEFLDVLLLSSNLYTEVHKLYLASDQSPQLRRNYRKLLTYVSDLELRQRLASEVILHRASGTSTHL